MAQLIVGLLMICLIAYRFIHGIKSAQKFKHTDPISLCFDILTGAGALLCAYALGSMN